jgi:hypothetical protein
MTRLLRSDVIFQAAEITALGPKAGNAGSIVSNINLYPSATLPRTKASHSAASLNIGVWPGL